MKNTIKTLLDSVELDNAEFIRDNDLKVSEYLLETSEALDQGWLFYLNEEEIEEFEQDEEKGEAYIKEITEFVNERYNYKLD